MAFVEEELSVAAMPATISKPTKSARRMKAWMPPLIVFAAIIGVWYLISYVFLQGPLRYLMPAPHEVLIQLFNPTTATNILSALLLSASVAMTGLVIAVILGVSWAVVMSQAKWAERSFFPYAVILQCIPILALVPLIGFWFGYGFPARTIVCVMIALFPIVSNTLFGLQSVDRAQLELFKLQGASRRTVLLKLQFPAASPAMFAGLRISAGLAVVGALVGDFFFQRGQPGLGALISQYQATLQSPQLFAAIVVASLFGVLVFWLFGLLRHRVIGKWYDAN